MPSGLDRPDEGGTAQPLERPEAHADHPPVLVVMGVSGAGKTTVARELAARLGWPFAEGDSLQPAVNVAKMRAGRPLDDADRQPWLDAIAAWIDAQRDAGRPGIITCSALKRAYRRRIVGNRPEVRLIYLRGSRDLIARRLAGRRGHFMPPSLLQSQLDTLEPPAADERAMTVDADAPVSELVDRIVRSLGHSAAPAPAPQPSRPQSSRTSKEVGTRGRRRSTRRDRLTHLLFMLGVIGKAVDGVLEVLGGVGLFLVRPEQINWMVRALTQHELSEDPNDVVAGLLWRSVQHLSVDTQVFAALFLLWHGVVKIALVVALLRRHLWAYPTAMVAFGMFTAYQFYRYSHTHSLWLLVLSLLDMIVIALTWFEYERLRVGRPFEAKLTSS